MPINVKGCIMAHTVDVHTPAFLKGVESMLAHIEHAKMTESKEQIEAARLTARHRYWDALKDMEDDGTMDTKVALLIGEMQKVEEVK